MTSHMTNPKFHDDPMSHADVTDLPLEGAFIVEFRMDAATAPADRLGGRIEHVTSGAATRFGSAHELLHFVRDVLRSHAQSDAPED
jgi:hypothetical protein